MPSGGALKVGKVERLLPYFDGGLRALPHLGKE
jgi:hypothetical protein